MIHWRVEWLRRVQQHNIRWAEANLRLCGFTLPAVDNIIVCVKQYDTSLVSIKSLFLSVMNHLKGLSMVQAQPSFFAYSDCFVSNCIVKSLVLYLCEEPDLRPRYWRQKEKQILAGFEPTTSRLGGIRPSAVLSSTILFSRSCFLIFKSIAGK